MLVISHLMASSESIYQCFYPQRLVELRFMENHLQQSPEDLYFLQLLAEDKAEVNGVIAFI